MFDANWKKYGKSAGPIRNKEMVNKLLEYKNKGIYVIVLSFHEDIENSKGTKHCFNYAKSKGLKIKHFDI